MKIDGMDPSGEGEGETVSAVARFMQERDQFARHLGIELLDMRAGFSRTRLRLKPYMTNGLGLPHGSIIFAVADFAFAAACNSYGDTAVALSMDVHFLFSPDPGRCLICEAEEIHRTRRTGLYRMQVTDEDGHLVAELHGMAYRKRTRFLEVENDI